MSPEITRTRFVMVPVELLEECGDRKGTLLVYCWLWHYAGLQDAAFPSASRLAAECHMKRDDVFHAIEWLCDHGWVRRERRPGQTTLYRVRTEAPSADATCPPIGGCPPKRGRHPKGDATRPPKGDTTCPPNGGHRTRTNNKNHLTRKEAAPSAPLENAEPTKAKPKPAGDPYAGKILPPNAVPFDLLELQDLLPEWWKFKKGVRSEAVFNRVCKKLRSWPAATRVTAVESAISGGWADIYEPRTPSAAPSGLWNGHQGRMSEAEKALAFLAARDAAQHAHTHYPQ